MAAAAGGAAGRCTGQPTHAASLRLVWALQPSHLSARGLLRSGSKEGDHQAAQQRCRSPGQHGGNARSAEKEAGSELSQPILRGGPGFHRPLGRPKWGPMGDLAAAALSCRDILNK